MDSRISGLRPKRPLSPERKVVKEALWSFHFHSLRFVPHLVPREFHPIPLSRAMEVALQWQDEHAVPRRARAFRRLDRPFTPTGEKHRFRSLKQRLRGADHDVLSSELSRRFGVDRHVARGLTERVHQESDDEQRCFATANDPSYNPKRGSTRLFSRLIVHRPLDHELACLLDPRGWDNCSDLLDETYQVIERDGSYVEVDTPPEEYGTNWEGLLYESADAGPQGFENILKLRFRVSRTCDPMEEWQHRASWHEEQRRGTVRSSACEAKKCDHPIESVEVVFKLFDSLSYHAGPLTLPGVMRQNNGFVRAWSTGEGKTKMSCLKRIQFGRVTQWSVAGPFDYGEILNYTAPTLLSLWVGDIEQMVPCCKQLKASASGSKGGIG